jgi:uncharacterized protein (DUF2237 family)
MDTPLNVLGGPLLACSHDPLTGWFRDGCCNTDDADRGSHTVCAQVTAPFLAFLAARGNDLVTPAPEHGFPGLSEGDRWCVCAASWLQAARAGHGCPVDLQRTHRRALRVVPLEELVRHAVSDAEA